MKSLIVLVLISLTSFVYSQNWRDTLKAGRDLYASQKYDQAYEKFVTAQRIAPEGIDLTKEIGNSAYRKGDFQNAEKAFSREMTATDDKLLKAKQAHNLGNAQMQQKNYSGAIESYKEALRANPESNTTRYNLSEAKRRLKDEQQKQEQQNQQNQQDQQDNQDEKKDGKDNQSGDGDKGNQEGKQSDKGEQQGKNNQNGEDQKQGSQNQQQGNSSNGNQQRENQSKLSSKKTDRMLDELMKKEMETKRKVQGGTGKGKNQEVKSGKRW